MSVEKEASLSGVQAGSKVRLVRVNAGCGLNQRLAAMGLVPGALMEIVRNEGNGQVIVNVKGSKVVLGRGMASKMIIS